MHYCSLQHRTLLPSPVTSTTGAVFALFTLFTPCRITQNGWVMVKSSDKMWSTGEGNGKPCYYSCLKNPMNSMKREKDMTLKDELHKVVGVQYATGEEWRNNSTKNEKKKPKRKQRPAADVTGDGSKVCFSSLITKISMFPLAISCLTTSNLP